MMNHSPEQLEVFPDRMYLRRTDATKKMNRFYFMSVQRDLFGGANLIREWGRVGSSGKVKVTFHADEGQAVNRLAQFARSKQKRGYIAIG